MAAQFTSSPTEDAEVVEAKVRLTSREHRDESRSLAELAGILVAMKPPQTVDIPLPDDVREAVCTCRRFSKGPRARELRRLSGLLRRLEAEEIAAIRDALRGRRGPAKREPNHEGSREGTSRVERWRDRLLSGGDEALAEFIEEHPMADPQALRQRLRAARRDPGSGKSKQALLGVLQMLREVGEIEASVRHAAARDAG